METLTMEQFQTRLDNEQDMQENALFEALRTIQQLAFSVDDIFDGVEGGWTLWT